MMSDDEKKSDGNDEQQKNPQPDILPPELDSINESYDPDKGRDKRSYDTLKD